MDDQEMNKLLEERTRKTAGKIEVDTYSGRLIPVFVFGLSSELYAIETCFIEEVLPLKEYTTVPGAPDFIKGIFNLRGQLYTMIDLSVFFSLSNSDSKIKNIIQLNVGGMILGIIADEFKGMRNVREDEISEETSLHTGKLSTYIKWITKDQLVALDVEGIIQNGELIVEDSIE